MYKTKKNYSTLKKIFFLLSSFLFFISSISFALAQNSVSVERIISFSGEIKVNFDSTIDVKENITYDFGENQKHGIFRFIPVKYKARGGNFNLRVSNIKITDENGAPYNFTTTYEGDNIKFQIGDADKLVSGEKNYVISYVIRRAVNYFSDHDELYWNFTGDQWPVPIESASVIVTLPDGAKENLQYKCYQGVFGSTAECIAEKMEENTLFYEAKGLMMAGEGMTIVAGWPKGITKEPTIIQKFWNIAKDNWTLFIPIIVFILMYRLWSKKGRDPKGRGTIIAQYESPAGLAPAEIGQMIDGSADKKDVSSTIIDLAVNKFLKIKRTEEKGFFAPTREG